MQEEAAKGSKIAYGTIELKMPKVYEWEIEMSDIKRETRKQKRKLHNARETTKEK